MAEDHDTMDKNIYVGWVVITITPRRKIFIIIIIIIIIMMMMTITTSSARAKSTATIQDTSNWLINKYQLNKTRQTD